MGREYHRTNITLYTKDVEWLERTCGRGWTTVVRDIIHDHVKMRKAQDDVAHHNPVREIFRNLNDE